MCTVRARPRAPLAILLALAFVLTACGRSGTVSPATTPPAPASSSPVPAAGPPPVAVRAFVPFGSGAATVTRTTTGSCWTASIAVTRPLAYRCFAGNEILDPCFAQARTDRVVTCYPDPWTSGVRLRVTRALPTDQPLLGAIRPWALELANGAHCVAATGVVGRIGSTVLLYRCGSAGAAGGPTAGSHPTVRFARGSSVSTVAVRVIWTA